MESKDNQDRHNFIGACLFVILFASLVLPGQISANESLRTRFFELSGASSSIRNKDPDSALSLAKEAILISSELNNDSLNMIAYHALAEAYFFGNNYPLALDYYFKSLQIEELTPVLKMNEQQLNTLLLLYSRIATCYFELDVTELSKEFFSRSLALINETEKRLPGTFSVRTNIFILFNVGGLYLEEKDLKNARDYFDEAERLNRSLNDSIVRLNYLINMGVYFKERNMTDQSLANNREALILASRIGQEPSLVKVWNNIGETYKVMGQYDEAIESFTKARQLGEEISAWRSVRISAEGLSDIYAEQGYYQKAFEMSDLIKDLNDSIFNRNIADKYARMALQYEFDKSLRLGLLKSDSVAVKQENRRLFSILLASLLFLLVTIAVIIIFYLHRKAELERLKQVYITLKGQHLQQENEKTLMELESKNRDLVVRAMSLIKKNEFIANIAKQLMDLSNTIPDQCGDTLNQIVKDINKESDQQFWKEFQVRFNDVHHDFYHKLNKRFPDLSPAETKLAAFLSLNLSTKEIATITYQSADSIKVARSRLRKKIGIQSNEKLISFLNKL